MYIHFSVTACTTINFACKKGTGSTISNVRNVHITTVCIEKSNVRIHKK